MMGRMSEHTILVTGGAGYIGSHVVRQLGEAGERVVVLDNLSTGFRSAVTHGELVVGDTADSELVARVLREHQVDTIMHFAAHTIVPESVADPLKYYRNNTAATRNLLECAAAAGVQHFVFSSTAAVYGLPPGGVAAEDTPNAPIKALVMQVEVSTLPATTEAGGPGLSIEPGGMITFSGFRQPALSGMSSATRQRKA